MFERQRQIITKRTEIKIIRRRIKIRKTHK